MVEIKVEPGETLEQALRRFNKEVQDIVQEAKDRAFYIKPSQIKRQKKKEKELKIARSKRMFN